MPRTTTQDDDRDDEDFDDDGDADDFEADADDDDAATINCPYCGWSIHEDSVRCPYCENYLSGEDATPARKPVWIIAGTVLCLIVIYFWVFG